MTISLHRNPSPQATIVITDQTNIFGVFVRRSFMSAENHSSIILIDEISAVRKNIVAKMEEVVDVSKVQ